LNDTQNTTSSTSVLRYDSYIDEEEEEMRKVIVFESKDNALHYLPTEPGMPETHITNVNMDNTMMIGKKNKDANVSWIANWINSWEEYTEMMIKLYGKKYVPTFDWKNILEHYNITMIEIDETLMWEDK
jgi:hypothetical protein